MRNIILLVIALIFCGCKTNRADIKVEEIALMNTSKAWSAAAQTKNVEDILSYWADDAVLYSPGYPTLKGKQAIREMIQDSYKIPGFQISWEPIQASIAENGDMGYLLENTTFSMIDSLGNRLTKKSRAVTIWKKDKDGKWKNVVNIWNEGPK